MKSRVVLIRTTVALACAAAWIVAGCPGPIGAPPDSASEAPTTVDIRLTSGKSATGELGSGQTLRAKLDVQAAHTYAVAVTLNLDQFSFTGGTPVVRISGAPLDEDALVTPTFGSGGLSPILGGVGGPSDVFLARRDGTVTLEIVNPSGDLPGAFQVFTIFGETGRSAYEILVTDAGFDDNGTGPDQAVPLPLGRELLGTFTLGDDGDFFVVALRADTAYELTLETNGSANVQSGFTDRFGTVQFGRPSASGLQISLPAEPGRPSVLRFTAPATEQVLLRITGGSAGFGLFSGGSLGSGGDESDVGRYAISIREVTEAPEP